MLGSNSCALLNIALKAKFNLIVCLDLDFRDYFETKCNPVGYLFNLFIVWYE